MAKKNTKIDSAGSAIITVESPSHQLESVSGVIMHRIFSGRLVSQWFTYQQIATLKTPMGMFHAATDHYHGVLPTNKIFCITEI